MPLGGVAAVTSSPSAAATCELANDFTAVRGCTLQDSAASLERPEWSLRYTHLLFRLTGPPAYIVGPRPILPQTLSATSPVLRGNWTTPIAVELCSRHTSGTYGSTTQS